MPKRFVRPNDEEHGREQDEDLDRDFRAPPMPVVFAVAGACG
jgi:hypothetical protein